MSAADHYPLDRYGDWAGNPGGVPFDAGRCAKEVWTHGAGMISAQCSRKPGHGPRQLFCKQHAKRYAYGD